MRGSTMKLILLLSLLAGGISAHAVEAAANVEFRPYTLSSGPKDKCDDIITPEFRLNEHGKKVLALGSRLEFLWTSHKAKEDNGICQELDSQSLIQQEGMTTLISETKMQTCETGIAVDSARETVVLKGKEIIYKSEVIALNKAGKWETVTDPKKMRVTCVWKLK